MSPENLKDYVQAVVDGLTPIAAKLQVPIENLWGWSLRHNYAVAVVGILGCALYTLLVTTYLIFLRWGLGEDKDMHRSRIYSKGLEAPFALASIVLAILSVHVIIELFNSVLRFYAPEWYTIKDLIGLVKPS